MDEFNKINYKTILLFSIPSILSSMLEPIAGFVDTSLVGHMNTKWLAALAICVTIFNSFSWMFNFLVYASIQTVSSSLALKDYVETTAKIKVSILIATGLGLLSALTIYFFRYNLYALASAEQSLIPTIESYFVIRLFGQPLSLLQITLTAIVRGLGKVKECFYIILITTLSNIIISYTLLYSYKMGVAGVAYGTVSASVIGIIISSYFILSDNRIRQHLLEFELPKGHWMSFSDKSINLFFRSALLTVSFFMSLRLAGILGANYLAAHQIIFQLWIFSSFFVDGFAITGNVLGAKFIGESKIDDFNRLIKILFHYAIIIGGIFTLVYMFLGRYLWGIFTDDVVLFKIIGSIWLLIASMQTINAFAFIADGILFGAGDFKYIRVHMTIAVLVIFLPILGIGYLNKNLIWVWIGMSALNMYRVASGITRVRRLKI